MKIEEKTVIKLFEEKLVRTAWNEAEGEWYFSIVDVVTVLTDSENPRRYWSDLKIKLAKEGSQLYEEILQLKLPSADGKKYLQVIGILSALVFSGCLAGNFSNSEMKGSTPPPTTPTQTQNSPPLLRPSVTKSFEEGEDMGYKEGKSWGRDGGDGLPQEFVLKHMANGWADQNGKSNDDAWKSGWINGFKNGFASTRGGKRGLEENPNYEKLALENATVGTKLYSNSEKHEATIVSVDRDGGLIYVRYLKSGSVEPKSITALGNTWFVKK